MKYSFFGIYLKTLVAMLILLGSVSYITFKAWENIDKASEVKTMVDEYYSYIPSADEGISFLLSTYSQNANHGIYMLIASKPDEAKITIAPIPWQLQGTSGTKCRTLDYFLEKSTARDVLNAVNESLGTNVTKYIFVDTDTIKTVCDNLGGMVYEVKEDVYYESETAFASIQSGLQRINGTTLTALLENPENFNKDIKGLTEFGSIMSALIYSQDAKRVEAMSESVFNTIINNSSTNLTAEDYLLRKDAINYMASNTEKIVNVISADGTFDITKDNFTPTDEFIKKLQAVFNS